MRTLSNNLVRLLYRSAVVTTCAAVLLLADGCATKGEVEKIVAPPTGVTDEQLEIWRQTSRNAWLAEVFTHALFVVHRSLTTDFLAGAVLALHRPHPQPKRQGLDTIAIYDEEEVAVMTISETKATADNPSVELINAGDMFNNVEIGG